RDDERGGTRSTRSRPRSCSAATSTAREKKGELGARAAPAHVLPPRTSRSDHRPGGGGRGGDRGGSVVPRPPGGRPLRQQRKRTGGRGARDRGGSRHPPGS